MRVRTIAFAIGLSIVPLMATAVSSIAAGGQVPTLIPASTVVKHIAHPCADRAQTHVQTCTGTLTIHVNSHVELRMPGGGAAACWSKYYLKGWVAWQENGGFGNELWYAREDVEDWYNGCLAGNVWISPSCHAYEGWNCIWPPPYSSFWDGGRGANTDWDNQETKYYCPFTCGDYLTYLRFWTTPGGSYSYWSQSQCIMC